MFSRNAPMTFCPTESAFIPWKQKIHSPTTKRLSFTLEDARIELMQYVLCMHKGLEVKIGNLYTDRARPNENYSWVYPQRTGKPTKSRNRIRKCVAFVQQFIGKISIRRTFQYEHDVR